MWQGFQKITPQKKFRLIENEVKNLYGGHILDFILNCDEVKWQSGFRKTLVVKVFSPIISSNSRCMGLPPLPEMRNPTSTIIH